MSIIRSDYEGDKIRSNKSGASFDLNHLFFKSEQTVSQGEVGINTVFHYQQKGNAVWATYSGGGIKIGNLCGTIAGDQMHFTYQQVNQKDMLRRGKCNTQIKIEDKRLTLHEEWEWDNGIKGQSKLVQIIM